LIVRPSAFEVARGRVPAELPRVPSAAALREPSRNSRGGTPNPGARKSGRGTSPAKLRGVKHCSAVWLAVQHVSISPRVPKTTLSQDLCENHAGVGWLAVNPNGPAESFLVGQFLY